MGEAHFRQLRAAALAEDCQVLPVAIARHLDAAKRELVRAVAAYGTEGLGGCNDLPEFWCMPFDRVMHLSRMLDDIDKEFIYALQERLVDGRIPVKARHPMTGEILDVKDPQLFTFDVPCMTPDEFDHYLMSYPHKPKTN